MSTNQHLTVVVLSCGRLGLALANRLGTLECLRTVAVVTTPYRMPKRTLMGKVKHLYRMQGAAGFVRLIGEKFTRLAPQNAADDEERFGELAEDITHLQFNDFHSPECLAAIRDMKPDLGVVAGTYILKESVFGLPRLGCINLHSGKVPEYRGAAPAFWELYNGETEVGITIHQVSAKVDEGAVLSEEVFPLDPAPPGDPLDYLQTFRRDVLQPNGIRMMVETVRHLADGSAVFRPQDTATGQTYRSPTYEAIKELRRRVRGRRS